MAAAVFYCARRAFDLTPPWPDRLTEATGGITPEIQDVAFCADRLFKEYQIRDNEVSEFALKFIRGILILTTLFTLSQMTPPRPKRRGVAGPDGGPLAAAPSSQLTPPPSAGSHHRTSADSSLVSASSSQETSPLVVLAATTAGVTAVPRFQPEPRSSAVRSLLALEPGTGAYITLA